MRILMAKKNEVSLLDINMALTNVRAYLIKNSVAREICKEFEFEADILYGVAISFVDDIDVAAKTLDSKMLLNTSLLGEKFEVMMRYVIHELVHVFQHIRRDSKKDPYDGMDYLDRPDEVEAFKFQLEFQDDFGGDDNAIEYVEDLIEYHEIPESEEGDKKEELLERVD